VHPPPSLPSSLAHTLLLSNPSLIHVYPILIARHKKASPQHPFISRIKAQPPPQALEQQQEEEEGGGQRKPTRPPSPPSC
jgi:hypothetical protein